MKLRAKTLNGKEFYTYFIFLNEIRDIPTF